MKINNNLWFIQRSAKSVAPLEKVSKNPEAHLKSLMSGSVEITGKMNPLAKRDVYIDHNNKDQLGDVGYKTTIILPSEVLKGLVDSTVLKHSAENSILENIGNWGNSVATQQVKLSSINSGDYYPNLFIGDKDLLTILKHTVIYGGKVKDVGDLNVIYQGEEAKKLLAEYKKSFEGQYQSGEKE